jgi:2-succinyl-5-enolpyruvyl-6-hydroxy-3-cyclohexene-1-carboxylate synthase
VVTTSGTAVGNLLPAVMEAHHSGVPLLVVSADRPAALVGTGANQTTDQTVILAGFLRHLARMSSLAPAASWPAQAARAVLAAEGALSRHPGPAQLNIELSEPLVAGDGPIVAPSTVPAVRTGAPGTAEPFALAGTPPTVVLCGDANALTGLAAVRLAEGAGLPLVAEPTSNARFGPNSLATGRLLLAGELGAQVQRVIVFGRPNLSRPVTALLSRPDVQVVIVTDAPDYVDPGWRASLVARAVSVEPVPADWLDAWQEADAARLADVTSVLDAPTEPTGPALARLVIESVDQGQVLCLGNSNPIRDADLAPVSTAPVRVFGNRGLSGIDGTISTATGVALATGAPTTLLCGDLAFCHDAGALAIGPGEPRPALRIVVADDAGGSIFATLEYGQPRFAEAFERVFATPTGLDPVAIAAGYGVPARRVTTLVEAATALAEPVTRLEVLVVSIDRSGRAGQARRIASGNA